MPVERIVISSIMSILFPHSARLINLVTASHKGYRDKQTESREREIISKHQEASVHSIHFQWAVACNSISIHTIMCQNLLAATTPLFLTSTVILWPTSAVFSGYKPRCIPTGQENTSKARQNLQKMSKMLHKSSIFRNNGVRILEECLVAHSVM